MTAMLEELIRQHAPRVALQFSGGRDSLAMLLLLRPLWDVLTVYHCDTGDAYPETRALVARVRAAVPSFVEVAGNSPATTEEHGWPSDVLPAGANWPFEGVDRLPLVDRHWCCFASHMLPMHRRVVADGITLVLRGQRDDDASKSPVRHGEAVDGITIAYPIRHWSAEDVETYIAVHGWDLPAFYAEGLTSAPDCMHCTAWLEHGALPYLGRHHPVAASVVTARLRAIRVAVEPHYARLVRATEPA